MILRIPRPVKSSGSSAIILRIAVAALVFWLGFDGGGYGLESRSMAAIAVWWAIIMAVLLGLWPLVRPTWSVVAAGGLVAAFAAWTAASIAWAPSAENAFNEFNRVALYLGVYLVAVLAASRGNAHAWGDALAIGITGVGVLALASRLFPTVLPAGDVPEFLPSAFARLSYPVEYWNGLAILVALALPFLLRAAVASDGILWRAAAVAPIPALAATIYLTSSRGGVATALIGTAAYVTLTARRWPAVGATAIVALASAGAVAVLLARNELVNDPFGSPLAPAQGRSAAVLILVICLLTGAAYALAARCVPAVARIPSFAPRAMAAAVLVAGLVAIAASSPVERFDTFREPPTALRATEQDPVRAHLLSGNGSGRWQFWNAAIHQFEEHPAIGRGAGSYEAWWARHGTIATFVRDAHSLYLETLAELGVVGALLLVAALAAGLAVGIRRLLKTDPAHRATTAAFLAAFVAYIVAAGIDWMWELTIVSVIGVLCLGFLTGPATEPVARPRLLRRGRRAPAAPGRRFAAGVAVLVAGWLLVCAQAIPLLSQVKVADSQAAVRRGDGAKALADAVAARNLHPWAAAPYLQLALVEEAVGDIPAARAWIREAIAREGENWRIWLVAVRLETKAGAIAEARASLRRAAALNPRSSLFVNVR